MNYLRKASLERRHLETLLDKLNETDSGIIKEIDVPCVTLEHLVNQHLPDEKIDLLVIDAEGHDSTIIRSIDFKTVSPEAIFFEPENSGDGKNMLY